MILENTSPQNIPVPAFAPNACTAAMVCTMTPLGNSDQVGGFPSTVMTCRRRGTKETMSWKKHKHWSPSLLFLVKQHSKQSRTQEKEVIIFGELLISCFKKSRGHTGNNTTCPRRRNNINTTCLRWRNIINTTFFRWRNIGLKFIL